MKAVTCCLEGVLLIEPMIYADDRGFFLETFAKETYQSLGITEDFVQDNHSRSAKNVLRGLHFTKTKPQAQIVTVIRGKIFDVVVDLRKDSPTFGQWFGTKLSDESRRQIYMPPGFAHGFCVLSEYADLHYKVSQRYDPADEGGLIWNDTTVNVDWPIELPIVSERDSCHGTLQDVQIQLGPQ